MKFGSASSPSSTGKDLMQILVIALPTSFVFLCTVLSLCLCMWCRKSPQPLHIKMEELTTFPHNVLGRGHFGIIVKGYYKKKPVAVKLLRNDADPRHKADMLKEVLVQSCLFNHPNVVKVLGVSMSNGPLMVVLELMDMSLEKYLKTNDDIHTRDMVKVSITIVKTFEYIEKHGYVHCDAAARNFLCKINRNKITVIKLGDWGLAQSIGGSKPWIRDCKVEPGRPAAELAQPTSAVELLLLHNPSFSSQSDVWSVGVLLWEIFSKGMTPMGKSEDLLTTPLPLCPGLPMQVYEIMRKCWVEDPLNRPRFSKLKHQLCEVKKSINPSDFLGIQGRPPYQRAVTQLETAEYSFGQGEVVLNPGEVPPAYAMYSTNVPSLYSPLSTVATHLSSAYYGRYT